MTDQIGGEFRQQLILAARPAVFDSDVLSFDEPAGIQSLAEGRQTLLVLLRRTGVQEADQGGRLRMHYHRCGQGCAGKKTKKLASSHSTTLSAEASKVSGTVSPSAFAVFMLSDSSNLDAW